MTDDLVAAGRISIGAATTEPRTLFLARLAGTQAEMGVQHARLVAPDAARLLAFYRTMPVKRPTRRSTARSGMCTRVSRTSPSRIAAASCYCGARVPRIAATWRSRGAGATSSPRWAAKASTSYARRRGVGIAALRR